MSIQELALQLPRADKMRLMEALWLDLSHQAEEMDSPAWHEEVLKETERRVATGAETAVDWDHAKRLLRRA